MTTTLSTITSDGHVEIPEEYRRALGLEPNDRLALTLEAGTIHLRRVPPPPPGSDWFWVPVRNAWVQWHEIQSIAREIHVSDVLDDVNAGHD